MKTSGLSALADNPTVTAGSAVGYGGLSEAPRARVVRQVKDWIVSGAIGHGQPLPSERVLAERLGVDRRTVRSALNMLGEDGMLRSNGGRMRLAVAPAQFSTATVRPGLMHDVVAVLVLESEDTQPHAVSRGNSRSTIHGALDAIRASERHALALHPGRFCLETVERLAQEGACGVVIPEVWGAGDVADWARLAKQGGLAVAVYGDALNLAEFDRVTSDHEAGSYEVTRWLLDQGRRRIVNVWPAPGHNYWFAARWAGHQRAMTEAGLDALPPILMPHSPADDVRDGRLLAGHLTELVCKGRGFDAIMLASDGHIARACDACERFGLAPGKDVLIAGYDNYWADMGPEHEAHRLAVTVDKDNAGLGVELVRLLTERNAGTLPEGPQRRAFAPRLVEVSR